MIYVFKIASKQKPRQRTETAYLQNSAGSKMEFDLDDCGKILHIDSDENIVLKITGLLNVHNFCCEELE